MGSTPNNVIPVDMEPFIIRSGITENSAAPET